MVNIRRTFLFLPVLLISVVCSQPQSTLRPVGPAAHSLAQIGWSVYILFGAVSLIMWGLLLWAAVRKRGSLDRHEPWNIGGGQNWVLIGGFAIPFVVLCGVFVMAMEKMTGFPVHDGRINPQIMVAGHQWWWEVQYIGAGPANHFTTANEIHIPVGRPVDILLVTRDVIHSFWVPALHGKVDEIPGQPNYIRVQANHAGSFEGQCGEYCGEQHAHMRLLVVAQPPDEYQAWLNAQLKPAAEPQDSEALHGRDVFNNAACALCHTVRGTIAQGKVAPDLTHLASRQNIAANTYKNDEANLEAWITHAQSLKPGCEMPNITAFNGRDIRALTRYLRELK
jgi:cytochrome c oxidase subunit II